MPPPPPPSVSVSASRQQHLLSRLVAATTGWGAPTFTTTTTGVAVLGRRPPLLSPIHLRLHTTTSTYSHQHHHLFNSSHRRSYCNLRSSSNSSNRDFASAHLKHLIRPRPVFTPHNTTPPPSSSNTPPLRNKTTTTATATTCFTTCPPPPPSSNPKPSSSKMASSSTQDQTSATAPTAPTATSTDPQQQQQIIPSPTSSIASYLCQSHERIFTNNRAWAADKHQHDPSYFSRLSAGQSPEYLWIGCSDSRIPAERITGLEPGEAFIHRNIANLVPNTDLNVMSVIGYAVRHLCVKHIVVCGHYGCGGVKAAMTPKDLGLLNPWLRNIRDVYRLHEAELDAIPDEGRRYDRLAELNVMEQCRNVVKTAAVQQSYAQNGYPIVHGWIFGFHDGLLKDLEIDFGAMLRNIQKIYNLTD